LELAALSVMFGMVNVTWPVHAASSALTAPSHASKQALVVGVNTCPALNADSPLDMDVMTNMVSDGLGMVDFVFGIVQRCKCYVRCAWQCYHMSACELR
jgi:hypothetical protein